jgi:hypothetical protein
MFGKTSLPACEHLVTSYVCTKLRLLTFLEDRRVLYSPYDLEIPDHCVRSVIEIRHRLTAEMEQLDGSSPLFDSISAIRTACRKFLDRTQALDLHGPIGSRITTITAWTFLSAIGELRGVFGIHIALIAARYGIDVEEQLADILPAVP